MRTLLLLLLAAAASSAQTTITGPLNVPTGGTFSGKLVITAPTQLTFEGETYVGWQRTITVSGGVFTIDLIPNIGSTPPGTAYRVQYVPNSGPPWQEYWYVPDSDTPLKVHEVRSEVVPTPDMVLRPDQLPPGTAAGQIWCWNGTEWVLSTSCGGSGGAGTPGQVTYGWDSALAHVVIPNPFTTEDVIILCSDSVGRLQMGIVTVALTAPFGITVDFDTAITGNCKISSGPSYGVEFSGQTLVSIQPEDHRLVGVKSSFCRDPGGVRLHPAVSTDVYFTAGIQFTGVRNYFDFPNSGRCAVIGAN